jgi:uncharacterized protein YndB with AHSA1/START domain
MDIDIAGHIGAAERELEAGERDGKPTRTVTARRVYDTDVPDLWDAITNPERMPRWFMPVTGDLREGGTYQIQGNASGTILRCDAPHHLAVTWEYGGGVSWLDVRLAGVAGGAQLELRHEVPVDDHWAQFGAGATGVGWDLGLMGLGEHIAGAAAADPAAVQAWYVSEQGRAFMQRSSAAWFDAALAAGGDEAAERAAAARTVAAYTGAPDGG